MKGAIMQILMEFVEEEVRLRDGTYEDFIAAGNIEEIAERIEEII